MMAREFDTDKHTFRHYFPISGMLRKMWKQLLKLFIKTFKMLIKNLSFQFGIFKHKYSHLSFLLGKKKVFSIMIMKLPLNLHRK